MSTYEDTIQQYCDDRISVLAKIKTRSLGADVLTLTALKVLVYAQLEGGVKDLASCLIHHINERRLSFGDIKPGLLQWRNSADLDKFRSLVNFEVIATASPFGELLTRRAKIRSINRQYEMNQMDWSTVKGIYQGFGLSHLDVEKSKTEIDEIVSDRNSAAHYGAFPSTAAALVEGHLRTNAGIVENVLTDMSIQMLEFFTTSKHKR